MRDPVDYTPLGSAPSRAELEQVRADARRGDLGRRTAKELEQPASATVIGGAVGGLLVLVGVITTVVQLVSTGADDVGIGIGFIVVGAGIGLGVGVLVRGADRRAWGRTVRLVLFARANGLEVEPVATTQQIPGIVGRTGSHDGTRGLVRWTVGDLPAHVADYHWGYSSGSIDCRYLAVRLGVEVPAMTFLCGRSGMQRPESRMGPDAFEGAAYSLRVGGLQPDARSTKLFTDELVALLTDHEHPTNAEVVDGWFIGYVRRSNGLSGGEWRHAFAVADVVTRQAALLES